MFGRPPARWFRRCFAACLALFYFLANSLLAHATEANIWSERRLPQLVVPAVHLNPLAPALSHRLAALFPKTAAPVIIHVKDIHRNSEAQRDISQALRALAQARPVGVIALEGAFGPVLMEDFRSQVSLPTRTAVAEAMLDANDIPGPIHAALTTPRAFPALIGVDDRLHHARNVAAFRQSQLDKPAALQGLAQETSAVERQKHSVFSPALLSFDALVTSYRNGEIKIGPYAEALLKKARPRADRPQLRNFVAAATMEAALKFDVIERERSVFLANLSPRITPEETNRLIEWVAGYRREELSPSEFYSHLKTLAKRCGVGFERTPRLAEYLAYIDRAAVIDAEKLLAEVRAEEERIYGELAKTPAQKALVATGRRLALARKLVTFELTPEEWDEYNVVIPAKAGIQVSNILLRPFEDFYREAEIRDQKMAENYLNKSGFPIKTFGNDGLAILVTGGFHGAGIDRKLRAAGYTVVSYTPTVSNIKTAGGSTYLNVFLREKTPLEKLFEGQRLFLSEEIDTPARRAGLAGLCTLQAGMAGEITKAEAPGYFRRLVASLPSLEFGIEKLSFGWAQGILRNGRGAYTRLKARFDQERLAYEWTPARVSVVASLILAVGVAGGYIAANWSSFARLLPQLTLLVGLIVILLILLKYSDRQRRPALAWQFAGAGGPAPGLPLPNAFFMSNTNASGVGGAGAAVGPAISITKGQDDSEGWEPVPLKPEVAEWFKENLPKFKAYFRNNPEPQASELTAYVRETIQSKFPEFEFDDGFYPTGDHTVRDGINVFIDNIRSQILAPAGFTTTYGNPDKEEIGRAYVRKTYTPVGGNETTVYRCGPRDEKLRFLFPDCLDLKLPITGRTTGFSSDFQIETERKRQDPGKFSAEYLRVREQFENSVRRLGYRPAKDPFASFSTRLMANSVELQRTILYRRLVHWDADFEPQWLFKPAAGELVPPDRFMMSLLFMESLMDVVAQHPTDPEALLYCSDLFATLEGETVFKRILFRPLMGILAKGEATPEAWRRFLEEGQRDPTASMKRFAEAAKTIKERNFYTRGDLEQRLNVVPGTLYPSLWKLEPISDATMVKEREQLPRLLATLAERAHRREKFISGFSIRSSDLPLMRQVLRASKRLSQTVDFDQMSVQDRFRALIDLYNKRYYWPRKISMVNPEFNVFKPETASSVTLCRIVHEFEPVHVGTREFPHYAVDSISSPDAPLMHHALIGQNQSFFVTDVAQLRNNLSHALQDTGVPFGEIAQATFASVSIPQEMNQLATEIAISQLHGAYAIAMVEIPKSIESTTVLRAMMRAALALKFPKMHVFLALSTVNAANAADSVQNMVSMMAPLYRELEPNLDIRAADLNPLNKRVVSASDQWVREVMAKTVAALGPQEPIVVDWMKIFEVVAADIVPVTLRNAMFLALPPPPKEPPAPPPAIAKLEAERRLLPELLGKLWDMACDKDATFHRPADDPELWYQFVFFLSNNKQQLRDKNNPGPKFQVLVGLLNEMWLNPRDLVAFVPGRTDFPTKNFQTYVLAKIEKRFSPGRVGPLEIPVYFVTYPRLPSDITHSSMVRYQDWQGKGRGFFYVSDEAQVLAKQGLKNSFEQTLCNLVQLVPPYSLLMWRLTVMQYEMFMSALYSGEMVKINANPNSRVDGVNVFLQQVGAGVNPYAWLAIGFMSSVPANARVSVPFKTVLDELRKCFGVPMGLSPEKEAKLFLEVGAPNIEWAATQMLIKRDPSLARVAEYALPWSEIMTYIAQGLVPPEKMADLCLSINELFKRTPAPGTEFRKIPDWEISRTPEEQANWVSMAKENSQMMAIDRRLGDALIKKLSVSEILPDWLKTPANAAFVADFEAAIGRIIAKDLDLMEAARQAVDMLVEKWLRPRGFLLLGEERKGKLVKNTSYKVSYLIHIVAQSTIKVGEKEIPIYIVDSPQQIDNEKRFFYVSPEDGGVAYVDRRMLRRWIIEETYMNGKPVGIQKTKETEEYLPMLATVSRFVDTALKSDEMSHVLAHIIGAKGHVNYKIDWPEVVIPIMRGLIPAEVITETFTPPAGMDTSVVPFLPATSFDELYALAPPETPMPPAPDTPRPVDFVGNFSGAAREAVEKCLKKLDLVDAYELVAVGGTAPVKVKIENHKAVITVSQSELAHKPQELVTALKNKVIPRIAEAQEMGVLAIVRALVTVAQMEGNPNEALLMLSSANQAETRIKWLYDASLKKMVAWREKTQKAEILAGLTVRFWNENWCAARGYALVLDAEGEGRERKIGVHLSRVVLKAGSIKNRQGQEISVNYVEDVGYRTEPEKNYEKATNAAGFSYTAVNRTPKVAFVSGLEVRPNWHTLFNAYERTILLNLPMWTAPAENPDPYDLPISEFIHAVLFGWIASDVKLKPGLFEDLEYASYVLLSATHPDPQFPLFKFLKRRMAPRRPDGKFSTGSMQLQPWTQMTQSACKVFVGMARHLKISEQLYSPAYTEELLEKIMPLMPLPSVARTMVEKAEDLLETEPTVINTLRDHLSKEIKQVALVTHGKSVPVSVFSNAPVLAPPPRLTAELTYSAAEQMERAAVEKEAKQIPELMDYLRDRALGNPVEGYHLTVDRGNEERDLRCGQNTISAEDKLRATAEYQRASSPKHLEMILRNANQNWFIPRGRLLWYGEKTAEELWKVPKSGFEVLPISGSFTFRGYGGEHNVYFVDSAREPAGPNGFGRLPLAQGFIVDRMHVRKEALKDVYATDIGPSYKSFCSRQPGPEEYRVLLWESSIICNTLLMELHEVLNPDLKKSATKTIFVPASTTPNPFAMVYSLEQGMYYAADRKGMEVRARELIQELLNKPMGIGQLVDVAKDTNISADDVRRTCQTLYQRTAKNKTVPEIYIHWPAFLTPLMAGLIPPDVLSEVFNGEDLSAPPTPPNGMSLDQWYKAGSPDTAAPPEPKQFFSVELTPRPDHKVPEEWTSKDMRKLLPVLLSGAFDAANVVVRRNEKATAPRFRFDFAGDIVYLELSTELAQSSAKTLKGRQRLEAVAKSILNEIPAGRRTMAQVRARSYTKIFRSVNRSAASYRNAISDIIYAAGTSLPPHDRALWEWLNSAYPKAADAWGENGMSAFTFRWINEHLLMKKGLLLYVVRPNSGPSESMVSPIVRHGGTASGQIGASFEYILSGLKNGEGIVPGACDYYFPLMCELIPQNPAEKDDLIPRLAKILAARAAPGVDLTGPIMAIRYWLTVVVKKSDKEILKFFEDSARVETIKEGAATYPMIVFSEAPDPKAPMSGEHVAALVTEMFPIEEIESESPAAPEADTKPQKEEPPLVAEPEHLPVPVSAMAPAPAERERPAKKRKEEAAALREQRRLAKQIEEQERIKKQQEAAARADLENKFEKHDSFTPLLSAVRELYKEVPVLAEWPRYIELVPPFNSEYDTDIALYVFNTVAALRDLRENRPPEIELLDLLARHGLKKEQEIADERHVSKAVAHGWLRSYIIADNRRQGRLCDMADLQGPNGRLVHLGREAVEDWIKNTQETEFVDGLRNAYPTDLVFERLLTDNDGSFSNVAEAVGVSYDVVRGWFANQASASLKARYYANPKWRPEPAALHALVIKYMGDLEGLAVLFHVNVETLNEWLTEEEKVLARTLTWIRNKLVGDTGTLDDIMAHLEAVRVSDREAILALIHEAYPGVLTVDEGQLALRPELESFRHSAGPMEWKDVPKAYTVERFMVGGEDLTNNIHPVSSPTALVRFLFRIRVSEGYKDQCTFPLLYVGNRFFTAKEIKDGVAEFRDSILLANRNPGEANPFEFFAVHPFFDRRANLRGPRLEVTVISEGSSEMTRGQSLVRLGARLDRTDVSPESDRAAVLERLRTTNEEMLMSDFAQDPQRGFERLEGLINSLHKDDSMEAATQGAGASGETQRQRRIGDRLRVLSDIKEELTANDREPLLALKSGFTRSLPDKTATLRLMNRFDLFQQAQPDDAQRIPGVLFWCPWIARATLTTADHVITKTGKHVVIVMDDPMWLSWRQTIKEFESELPVLELMHGSFAERTKRFQQAAKTGQPRILILNPRYLEEIWADLKKSGVGMVVAASAQRLGSSEDVDDKLAGVLDDLTKGTDVFRVALGRVPALRHTTLAHVLHFLNPTLFTVKANKVLNFKDPKQAPKIHALIMPYVMYWDPMFLFPSYDQTEVPKALRSVQLMTTPLPFVPGVSIMPDWFAHAVNFHVLPVLTWANILVKESRVTLHTMNRDFRKNPKDPKEAETNPKILALAAKVKSILDQDPGAKILIKLRYTTEERVMERVLKVLGEFGALAYDGDDLKKEGNGNGRKKQAARFAIDPVSQRVKIESGLPSLASEAASDALTITLKERDYNAIRFQHDPAVHVLVTSYEMWLARGQDDNAGAVHEILVDPVRQLGDWDPTSPTLPRPDAPTQVTRHIMMAQPHESWNPLLEKYPLIERLFRPYEFRRYQAVGAASRKMARLLRSEPAAPAPAKSDEELSPEKESNGEVFETMAAVIKKEHDLFAETQRYGLPLVSMAHRETFAELVRLVLCARQVANQVILPSAQTFQDRSNLDSPLIAEFELVAEEPSERTKSEVKKAKVTREPDLRVNGGDFKSFIADLSTGNQMVLTELHKKIEEATQLPDGVVLLRNWAMFFHQVALSGRTWPVKLRLLDQGMTNYIMVNQKVPTSQIGFQLVLEFEPFATLSKAPRKKHWKVEELIGDHKKDSKTIKRINEILHAAQSTKDYDTRLANWAAFLRQMDHRDWDVESKERALAWVLKNYISTEEMIPKVQKKFNVEIDLPSLNYLGRLPWGPHFLRALVLQFDPDASVETVAEMSVDRLVHFVEENLALVWPEGDADRFMEHVEQLHGLFSRMQKSMEADEVLLDDEGSQNGNGLHSITGLAMGFGFMKFSGPDWFGWIVMAVISAVMIWEMVIRPRRLRRERAEAIRLLDDGLARVWFDRLSGDTLDLRVRDLMNDQKRAAQVQTLQGFRWSRSQWSRFLYRYSLHRGVAISKGTAKDRNIFIPVGKNDLRHLTALARRWPADRKIAALIEPENARTLRRWIQKDLALASRVILTERTRPFHIKQGQILLDPDELETEVDEFLRGHPDFSRDDLALGFFSDTKVDSDGSFLGRSSRLRGLPVLPFLDQGFYPPVSFEMWQEMQNLAVVLAQV